MHQARHVHIFAKGKWDVVARQVSGSSCPLLLTACEVQRSSMANVHLVASVSQSSTRAFA